jgi:hypothetical protein
MLGHMGRDGESPDCRDRDAPSREELAALPTDALLELHRRLTQQQRWLEARWRVAGDDAQVVVHLLRLWAEGAAVAEEVERRLSPPDD